MRPGGPVCAIGIGMEGWMEELGGKGRCGQGNDGGKREKENGLRTRYKEENGE